MSKVGFIGLGIMGRPMAKNLIKNGYSLVVFDRSPAAIEELASCGAEKANSVAELSEICDVILTMLPNSPDVKEIALSEQGIISTAKEGTLVVDMTSGAPTDSKEIYAALKEKGIKFIDAPVSGGEPMAIEGTLAIMVGGDKEDFERAVPYLQTMSKTATWVGPIGSGNTCKLTNQIIVALNIAALSEGLMLAKKAGADTQLVFDAIKGGLAGSNVMNAKAPMILAENFKPGFRIDLHIKDLTNAMITGEKVDAPLPFTTEILNVLKKLSSEGNGSCDHSAIAKHYEELADTKYAD